MTNYPHLAQRLFNTPLALLPSKGEMVMAALADRFGIARLFRAGGQPVTLSDALDGDFSSPRDSPSGYDVVAGVAVIPITGTLVAKLGKLRPYSGMTGYDGIRANISMALEDPAVRAIALDVDSPGGEVAGCFDLVDAIYAARGHKPIWAILSESAYSAAYAIASACDRITVPRTGGTGSVGVICMAVEFSRALESAGVTVTIFMYGDRKADGNEYSPMEKAARERFQADVDAMGELFVQTVARNRALAVSRVRSTQATTFLGASGVEIGFADAVMAPDEAFRSLLAELDA